MQFSTLIFIYLNFSFGITLVIFMKSHVMPNVYLLQNFMTFVAICFKYLFVFSAFFALFSVFCICACAEYWKISNV